MAGRIVVLMKWVTGIGLLASAYAPLVAVLTLMRLGQLGWIEWAILGACVLAVAFLSLVLRSVYRVQERSIVTVSVRHADERVVAFTSSYIVPIVVAGFAPSQTPALVATLVLLALMITIYVRAGLYHLNPTLAAIGFRLYEVTTETGTVVMLLARTGHIPQRGEVRVHYLSENVAIQRRGRT